MIKEIIQRVLIIILFTTFSGCKNSDDVVQLDNYQCPNYKQIVSNNLNNWAEGNSKAKIKEFVRSVTNEYGKEFVPPQARIALFDLDGTLLVEKPNYLEVVIAQSQLNNSLGRNDISEVLLSAFEGMSQKEFRQYVLEFIETKQHPTLHKKYCKLFYMPMLELIQYLKRHEFTIYLVSTSQQEFIRGFSEAYLSIPFDNVIGSPVNFEVIFLNDKITFIREHEWMTPYNDREGKPIRIWERVGRLPILAVGNSSGDINMLKTVDSNANGLGLSIILNHDDPHREFKYFDEELLALAKQNDWLIASMKNDFITVFFD